MIGDLIGAAASMFGGIMGQKSQQKMAQQNIDLQKQFAQQGIQWKVNDAKAAGIHPLYALGAQTHSFAPVSVGDSIGPAIANAGQFIGRAAQAGATSGQRVNAVSEALQQAAVEKAGLENELLRSQIRLMNQPGTPPSFPGATPHAIPGQGNAPLPEAVKSVPGTITGADQSGWREGYSIPDVGYAQTYPGFYAPVPSKDVKERIEDIMPAEWAWAIRSYMAGATDPNRTAPAHSRRAPWQMWRFHPLYGHYLASNPQHDRVGRTRYFSPPSRFQSSIPLQHRR